MNHILELAGEGWRSTRSSGRRTARSDPTAESRSLQLSKGGSPRPVRPNLRKEIYLRGLIEFTNFCKNDCYYCGIRKSNRRAERYRLTQEEVLACCDMGLPPGFSHLCAAGRGGSLVYRRTALQAGGRHQKAVSRLRRHPLCGGTQQESYQRLFDAGADRYLLRHETATESHYKKTSSA